MQEPTTAMKSSGALEITQRLGEISGGVILDIATQQGSFINVLMKTLKDYDSFFGIDISEEHIEKAKNKFSDDPVEFEIMNAEELTFKDNSFDTVCMSHSIHHMKNPNQALDEMIRVLKPGGYLILQEMFRDSDQSEAKQNDIASHHWGAKIDRFEGESHFETYSREQLRTLVGSLDVIELEDFESERYLKCLFCEDMEKCGDPKNNIEFAIEEIDRILKRAEKHPQYEELSQEAQELREKIESTGSMPASLLLFICRK
ncbi:MAG: methyltransferase domain-containing protein [Candidatus Thorarchaeota archaeon]